MKKKKGIDQSSIKFRKAKTKVITLANHKRRRQTKKQSELEANSCSRRQARENTVRKLQVVLFLLRIGWESGARYFSQ